MRPGSPNDFNDRDLSHRLRSKPGNGTVAGEGVVWPPLHLEALDVAPDHMVQLRYRLDRDGAPSFDASANSSLESVTVVDVEAMEEVGDDPTFCRWTRI